MQEQLTYICDNQRHLICQPYTIENLHRMAKELNIKRCWFHKSALGFAHYDIPKLRIDEIQKKSTVVSTKELLTIIKSSIDGRTKDNRRNSK